MKYYSDYVSYNDVSSFNDIKFLQGEPFKSIDNLVDYHLKEDARGV